MRADNKALDAVVRSLRLDLQSAWRETTFDVCGTAAADFDQYVATLCASPSGSGQRGARTAQRIASRVSKRAANAERRTALDLQRLADLEQRMSVRTAEAARRRWFVLGRALERAATADRRWSNIVDQLLASAELTAGEKRLLEKWERGQG